MAYIYVFLFHENENMVIFLIKLAVCNITVKLVVEVSQVLLFKRIIHCIVDNYMPCHVTLVAAKVINDSAQLL